MKPKTGTLVCIWKEGKDKRFISDCGEEMTVFSKNKNWFMDIGVCPFCGLPLAVEYIQ
jgi:hypothetical protein